jgi:hypothetical protein
MVADADLLEKATRAGDRFAEAERQALLCRAEYHTAIRRLHLAGASLREIANALSLSHQRVQQIVAMAGGSWWRRVWRTRTVTRDAVCTWCNRPPSEVSGLIAGPNVYICDGCVALAEQKLADGSEHGCRLIRAKRGATRLCAFCYKRGGAAHRARECLQRLRAPLPRDPRRPSRLNSFRSRQWWSDRREDGSARLAPRRTFRWRARMVPVRRVDWRHVKLVCGPIDHELQSADVAAIDHTGPGHLFTVLDAHSARGAFPRHQNPPSSMDLTGRDAQVAARRTDCGASGRSRETHNSLKDANANARNAIAQIRYVILAQ